MLPMSRFQPATRTASFAERCAILALLAGFAAAHVYGAMLIAAVRAPAATMAMLQGD